MAWVSDDFRFLAEVASEARSAKSSSRNAATLTSISVSSSLFRQKRYKKKGDWSATRTKTREERRERRRERKRGSVWNVPIVLELQLQLQTLDFYFSLSLVLQNCFVWLPVFGGCDVPRRSTLSGGFVRPEDRQVALDVTIRTARKRGERKCETSVFKKPLTRGVLETYLPRGVVNPIPLYMVVGWLGVLLTKAREYHGKVRWRC